MKKVLAILVAVSALGFVLAGCSKSDDAGAAPAGGTAGTAGGTAGTAGTAGAPAATAGGAGATTGG